MLSNSVRPSKGSENMPCQLAVQAMLPSAMILTGYGGEAADSAREALASAAAAEGGCSLEEGRRLVLRAEELAAEELHKV